MSIQHIRKSCLHFQLGRTDLKDSLHSGQSKTPYTDEFKLKVAALIEEDNSITILEMQQL